MWYQNYPIIFVAVLSMNSLSDGKSWTKIVGGRDSEPGEYPWQVSIQVIPITGTRYHNCGGSILNSEVLVTAAHCIQGKSLSMLQVVGGAHNVKDSSESTQQRRNIQRVLIHPNYSESSFDSDVALVFLTEPFELNERIQPIRIPPSGLEPEGNCTASGWGNANPTGGSPELVPDVLQEIELRIKPRSSCAEDYVGELLITSQMICAVGSKDLEGTCVGDSGGPLVCKNNDEGEMYLAGVVSWGMKPCGQFKYPSVFTHLGSSSVNEFLRQMVPSLNSNN